MITAQNLIEILEATAHNTKIPLDKLEVCFEDTRGYSYDVNGYEVVSYFENDKIDYKLHFIA